MAEKQSTRESIFSEKCRHQWHEVESSIWKRNESSSARDPVAILTETLFDEPRWIPPSFLYDPQGSVLFDEITRLPEYYLTRTEDGILEEQAGRIIASARADVVVELGAGFSRKTVHLLSEQVRWSGGGVFAPIDVSLTALRASRDRVTREFPSLDFHGICASYEEGIASVSSGLPTLLAFLGSSVGNFNPELFTRFFRLLSGVMSRGDSFLLGVDRVKDPALLERAYNDSRGLTARFITNVLVHINRIAGTDFDPGKMTYRGVFNPELQQMEMYLIGDEDQRLELQGRELMLRRGERILVEISRKFDPSELEQELSRFGLNPVGHFTDSRQWYSLLLFSKGAARADQEGET